MILWCFIQWFGAQRCTTQLTKLRTNISFAFFSDTETRNNKLANRKCASGKIRYINWTKSVVLQSKTLNCKEKKQPSFKANGTNHCEFHTQTHTHKNNNQ